MAVLAFADNRSLQFATRFPFILTLFYFHGPTQIALLLVQLDILTLFLVLCTYLLHRRGYNTAAGLPLALAIAIKPTVGVVLLFFAWKRRWRILAVTVATVVLLTGLGFCVVGWARFPDYLEVVQLWSSGALLVFPHNQSVRGLALRAFTTNAYNQPLHVVPWLGYAVPILIGLLAVGSWTASISLSDNRTESVGSV